MLVKIAICIILFGLGSHNGFHHTKKSNIWVRLQDWFRSPVIVHVGKPSEYQQAPDYHAVKVDMDAQQPLPAEYSLPGFEPLNEVFAQEYYNGKTYLYFPELMYNWIEAHAFCRRHGMEMVTFSSRDEFDFVVQFLTLAIADLPSGTSSVAWIGVSDFFGAGDYYNIYTGQSFTLFDPQSNNANNNEHCVEIRVDDDTMYFSSVNCDQQSNVLCTHKETCTCEAPKPSCHVCWKGALQLALVLDTGETYSEFIATFQEMVPEYTASLSLSYPGTEFAVTSFVDWESRQNYNYNSGAYCYKKIQNFTENVAVLYDSISSIDAKSGGYDEAQSSLNAILYTALDDSIGWRKGLPGKAFRKVIAVVTDSPWKYHNDGNENFFPEYNLPLPVGDARDNCSNGPAQPELVFAALKRNKFFIVPLISGTVMQTWLEYFDNSGLNPNYFKNVELGKFDADILPEVLLNALREMLCPIP